MSITVLKKEIHFAWSVHDKLMNEFERTETMSPLKSEMNEELLSTTGILIELLERYNQESEF